MTEMALVFHFLELRCLGASLPRTGGCNGMKFPLMELPLGG